MKVETAPVPDAAPGWRAELALQFARGNDFATRLIARRHMGPLVVQRPFYPEGPEVPHVYVLHPPGGLVGGDRLRLDVTADAGARVLLTTPAATKVYRSAGPVASQVFRFAAGQGACVEWLPQETILHDAANADLSTEVHLSGDARFMGMDTLCFGLSARGETFATGKCRQRFEIWRDGRPIFIERGRFDADDAVHAASWGLGGARVSGLLVIAPGAAVAPEMLERLREVAAQVPERAGVTVLDEGNVWVCRYLGGSAERARTYFQHLWAIARPVVMGRPAVVPRIWAT
ncbi:MAG: urease accessory protein UreD [Deltaproteobacteria bacterium]|nr:urease accessory protein UreD [Deltaproteobacteria bacterium]